LIKGIVPPFYPDIVTGWEGGYPTYKGGGGYAKLVGRGI